MTHSHVPVIFYVKGHMMISFSAKKNFKNLFEYKFDKSNLV